MPYLPRIRKALKAYLLSKAEWMIYHDRQSKPNAFFRDRFHLAMKEMNELYAQRFGCILPERANRIDLLTELQGTTPTEAFYILHYLNKCLRFSGDICEFGIAQGATSALMANEIRDTDKRLWLFDSFEGLPAPTEKDVLKDDIFGLGSMQAYRGTMRSGTHEVTTRLRRIEFPAERVKLITGLVEKTIHQPQLPRQVCFAYVDFDFYEPIQTALTYLDRVLVAGGCIIVDDYDWFSTGAKTAVDEFMNRTQGRYRLDVPDPVFGHFCLITQT